MLTTDVMDNFCGACTTVEHASSRTFLIVAVRAAGLQWGCSMGNSPRAAGLGLRKHGIKLDLLNIVENEDY